MILDPQYSILDPSLLENRRSVFLSVFLQKKNVGYFGRKIVKKCSESDSQTASSASEDSFCSPWEDI